MSRWLREPLLHFALIGAALFFLFGRLNPGDESERRIVVTQSVVDDLARQHQARWLRPASAQELSGLVQAHVRDEILYREGLALGLERDDPVIKRRLRQKLELMSEEQLAPAAPAEADLVAYLARNAVRFMRPAAVSFDQIYFSGAVPVAEVERQVAAARTALARGTDPARLGQPTMRPHRAEQMSVELIARDFGASFAAQLTTLPEGEWTGPVASALGAHLVKVSARTPAVLPPLDAVRQQVAREWENERRERSRTENYRQLRERYDVVIEPALVQTVASQP
jgi:hypothetical protein